LRAAQRSGGGRRGSIAAFLRDTRQELKKVEWPTREEATKLTAAVVGLSAIVGVFLGGVDFVFQEFFKLLIGLTGGGLT
jgi:preprotein translocase subunit SecE